ncbi:aspartate/glutamate racemase family protein [Streptomyces sp. NPDC048664]|uniref:aspartate/glutamate racemase family protein n=1 Tax=Streptomyces sp. NPDC048664 TaxID=3154505 RepID=UPI003413A52D
MSGAPTEGTLALLHTSPVHVPVFEALRDASRPGLGLQHFVAEDLLLRARERGPEDVADAVRALIGEAVGAGADAVLCTCSTLGVVAERAAAQVGVPVLRVDRPMAAAAVAAGPRIVVVAAVESTLEPTVALIRQEAAGRAVEVVARVVDGAWERFEAGDTEGYAQAVAAGVDGVVDADVIVLAQASMTVARHLVTTALPVLASPESGFAAAAEAAARAAAAAAPGNAGRSLP